MEPPPPVFFRERPCDRGKCSTHRRLTIATINIKNIKTNKAYAQQLLKNTDILCIQEHWLFSFELDSLNQLTPYHRCHSKAVDDNDPVSPAGPPRGYGGVAILYRTDWNLKVVECPDGGNRICVIELQSKTPTLIVNVYLPSRKYVKKDSSTGDPDEYEAVLAQVQEIIQTYEGSHSILLCGDMNASLKRRQGNPQDQLLFDFVNQMNLISYQSGSPTFFHDNGKDKSEIDYILTSSSEDLISEPTSVMQKDPINLSDHTSLQISLQMDFETSPSQKLTITVKPKWLTCNVRLYKETVRNNLRSSFGERNQNSNSLYDVQCQIRELTSVLKSATEKSIPRYKPEIVKEKLKPQQKWTPDVYAAIRNCRRTWGEWKAAGQPDEALAPNYHRSMKTAKVNLRKTIRQCEAKARDEKLQNIMDSENNSKSFHTLVRMQRKSSNPQTRAIVVAGKEYDTPESVCTGWREHFLDLSTPKENPQFQSQYKDRVKTDLIHIEEICRLSSEPITPTTEQEIRKTLKNLKNNKAADSFGLMSEHFTYCTDEVVPYLVDLVNEIFSLRRVPDILNEGILTPVYKKGDPTNPSNYRGISVTPILLKIIEHVLNTRHNPPLLKTQSKLQKGFTEKTSSMNAAMILSECINESNVQKKPLYVAALDVQKAFDVVDHDSLLRKLYLDGISGDDWLLLKDLYAGMTAKVKWDGFLSSPLIIRQGVRQGGDSLSESLQTLQQLPSNRGGRQVLGQDDWDCQNPPCHCC